MRKKLAAIVLVIAITVSLGIPVFAADGVFRMNQTSLGIKVGETVSLTADYGNASAVGTMWMSDNPNVATVDGNGNVTGVSLGQAVITATSGVGETAKCYVHVALKGIDVSRYQYNIDWNSVKNAGVDFAIIRTGFGGENWEQQTDPYFEANYSGARQNGIKVGVYHYSYATNTAMAAQEADMCLSILKGRPLDYPVFYDVEDSKLNKLSPDQLAAIVTTFCGKIQQAGYKVGLYSFVNFFKAHLTSPSLDQYDKWVANTGVNAPNYSKPYTMWQYGQRPVAGISGNTDVNYSYVDYSGSAVPVTPTDPTNPMPSDYFKSDTNGTYTFGENDHYFYKITTPDTFPPTAASSNPSAVTVQLSKKLADGFLFRITRVGAGEATITTTAGDGRSVSFVAVANSGSIVQPTQPGKPSEPSNPETPSTDTVVSDTPEQFTMKAGSTYQFKFTPGNASPYTFSSGNSSILKNISTVKNGRDYYFKVKAVGTGAVGIYANKAGKGGPRVCVVTVAGSGTGTVTDPETETPPVQTVGIVSDTPEQFSIKLGSTYQFKFSPSKPASYRFTSGNGSVLKNVSTKKIGNDYYYKVKAVGKGAVGVYGQEVGKGGPRLCVVTVV